MRKKYEGFPIEFVKSPMYEAFWAHFRDHFARCPDLPIHEFHSYLADFSHFRDAEAASCKGLVTACKVHDALKQVSFNKSPGLNGLPFEVYLRMSHMFDPILMDMFNYWFAQHYQGCDHIAEERWQACLGGFRSLQAI